MDRESRDVVKRRIRTDQRDIGTVQRGDNLRRRLPLAFQNLAGKKSARGVRYGVVNVKNVQVRAARNFRHFRCQRQGIGRELEQGVGSRFHTVKHKIGLVFIEPEGQCI